MVPLPVPLPLPLPLEESLPLDPPQDASVGLTTTTTGTQEVTSVLPSYAVLHASRVVTSMPATTCTSMQSHVSGGMDTVMRMSEAAALDEDLMQGRYTHHKRARVSGRAST